MSEELPEEVVRLVKKYSAAVLGMNVEAYHLFSDVARLAYAEGVKVGREQAAKKADQWPLKVENAEAAERWNKAGGFMNAVAGAANAISAAIRKGEE